MEAKNDLKVNVDNKDLLKSLVDIVSNFSNTEEFSYKFAVILEQIFLSGLQGLDNAKGPTLRSFLAGSLEFLGNSVNLRNDLFSWISSNLQTGDLSKTFSLLLSDTEHIKNHYNDTAFIRSERYSNALMVCLLAIEKNQLNLLAQIDPTLCDSSSLSAKKGHKRSSSQPHFTKIFNAKRSNLTRSKTTDPFEVKNIYSLKLRPWQSLPDVRSSVHINRPRSKTISNQISTIKINRKKIAPKFEKPAKNKVPSFTYTDQKMEPQMKSCNNLLNLEKCPVVPEEIENIRIHYDCKDCRFATPGCSSPVNSLPKKKSFFNLFESKKVEGQKQMTNSPPTDYGLEFSPGSRKEGLKHASTTGVLEVKNSPEERTRKISTRESIKSMIDDIQCHRIQTGLEQENAHFIISEALIATIEKIKWDHSIRRKYKIVDSRIKAPMIPLTKQIVLKTKPMKVSPPSSNLISSSKMKFVVGSAETDSESNCSSEELSNRRNSFDSESIQEHAAQIEWDDPAEANSAENIALMLIKRFSGQKTVPEGLKWLVKDGQSPQEMLPLPGSGFIVNPDDSIVLNAEIRGTKDWAPPRNQVIFTMHPIPDRKSIMTKQNYLCPGCGIKAVRAYAHKFRYCEYYGKYFCSGCHKEQKARIPARILENWDFEHYSVSTSAYKFLQAYRDLPLFHVADLNPKLYEKAKNLKQMRDRRVQFNYLHQFMSFCRFGDKVRKVFENLRFPHWLGDPDIWSITDFDNVVNGNMLAELAKLFAVSEEHIKKCELCTARGFLCEGCSKKDLIFPWHSYIKRCNICGSCYHEKCFTGRCTRCERLKRYGKSIAKN